MRIDSKLNFVFPVETDQGNIYVHSMPIARVVFETYYDVLGKVFTRCFDGQDAKHVALTAPQLALPALKALATEAGNWEGVTGVRNGLLNEIIRLTNISHVGPNGWESLPLELARQKEIVDEESLNEVLSSLVFFTSISKVAPRSLAGTFLEMAGSLRNWQFGRYSITEFTNSLRTSNQEETTTVNTSPVVS